MSPEIFDFVMPLYRLRWNTRAVLEGITAQYAPRAIHVIAPEPEAQALNAAAQSWQTAPVHTYAEENFFHKSGLSKDVICAELDLGESLYSPGWFYQQLLKLGAAEGIDQLSEWFVVWDSDLLPVEVWPLVQVEAQPEIQPDQQVIRHSFALLQHNQWGNARIVSAWADWIRSVLGVEPLKDHEGTFVPHHMWFKQAHLESMQQQLGHYFQSNDSWLLLLMRSANQFGTFSEYWGYASWVAAKAPEDLSFYPYERYGATTERFFDDGTGIFSAALRQHHAALPVPALIDTAPSYAEVMAFIRAAYGSEIPSSLSFESSPRHLKKGKENMHIEELRSRWHLLKPD